MLESPTIGRVASSWQRHHADAEWPRPGYAADGGQLGEFEVLAASVIGQGHLHRAAQRQDAYDMAAGADGVVLGIADGVSAKRSAAIGAEVAAFVAVRRCIELGRRPDREDEASTEVIAGRLADAIGKADAAVAATAADLEIAAEELSTTLLLAHLDRTRSGSIAVTTAAVGNSSALELTGAAAPRVISGPAPEDRRAYGEFLPGAAEAVRATRSELRPGAVLVLATDGLAEDLHASAAVRQWVWERLSSARTPLEFANALSYRRQGSSDDLTAVAVRAAPLR